MIQSYTTEAQTKSKNAQKGLLLALINQVQLAIKGYGVYRGRFAIYELMPLCDEVQQAILQGNSVDEIRTKAEKYGFVSLQTQGFDNVTQGITTLSEWIRALA